MWRTHVHCGPWNFRCYAGRECNVLTKDRMEFILPPHAVERWLFIHRSGRRGRGTEPLSFFEDWDSATGDVAVPTPTSSELAYFCYDTVSPVCQDCDRSRARCVKLLLGSTAELLWRIPPPKEAIKWKHLKGKKRAASNTEAKDTKA